MRIRTIKPEWWKHPVLSRMSDSLRLLALACISLADDEGYFYADPKLVRSECFPFTDDSVNVHGALKHLSNVGWIELFEHPEMGLIGLVKNFAKHQKINRPSESKIKSYVDSLNDHGALTDRSPPEQGTGNREQGTGSGTGKAIEPEDPFENSPPTKPAPPPDNDQDRWRIELQHTPWARALLNARAKCGPKNWRLWKSLIDEHGQDAIVAACRDTQGERWPDAVESTLTAPGARYVAQDDRGGYVGEVVDMDDPEGFVR